MSLYLQKIILFFFTMLFLTDSAFSDNEKRSDFCSGPKMEAIISLKKMMLAESRSNPPLIKSLFKNNGLSAEHLILNNKIKLKDSIGRGFSIPFKENDRLYLAYCFDKSILSDNFNTLLAYYFRSLDIQIVDNDSGIKLYITEINRNDLRPVFSPKLYKSHNKKDKLIVQDGFLTDFNSFFIKTIYNITASLASMSSPGSSEKMSVKDTLSAKFIENSYLDTVKNLLESIIVLSENPAGIPPSLINHPTLENVAFLYDAAVIAMILKAGGKQKAAEKVLDYFDDILKTELKVIRENKDSEGTFGILKLYKGQDGQERTSLLNAIDVSSRKSYGSGILEFYTTPGPNSFLYYAMNYVNYKKYADSIELIFQLLASMQNSNGGVLDGDRLPDDVHTEPHCDAAAVFFTHEKNKFPDKWPEKAESAYQWFIKNVFDSEKALIFQGTATDKYFATDAYSWTMAGPFGDRLAEDYGLIMLKRLTENMLRKSLVSIKWQAPGENIYREQLLVDFTDPQSEVIKRDVEWSELSKNYGVGRGGYHPMGSAEWTGGVILALEKNAVRSWERGEKLLAVWFKDLAKTLENEVFKSYYSVGQNTLCGPYATGQNRGTGHSWITPLYNIPGVLQGCSPVSCWPLLPLLGINPFIHSDKYKDLYLQIPFSGEDSARKNLLKLLINPPYEEKILYEIPEKIPRLREPRGYLTKMWQSIKDEDIAETRKYALEVYEEPKWREKAIQQNITKEKLLGGVIDYPWGKSYLLNRDHRHEAIWKFPVLNEYAASVWGLIYAEIADNPGRAEELMLEMIENYNLAQIADGKDTEVILEGKSYSYFSITGYWNPVHGWQYPAKKNLRDALMSKMFIDLVKKNKLEKNIPQTVLLDDPSAVDNFDLKYLYEPPVEIWLPCAYSKTKIDDDIRDEYSLEKDLEPLKLMKGDVLVIDYSLNSAKSFAMKLHDDGFLNYSLRNSYLFNDVSERGQQKAVIKNDLLLRRMAFYYGRYSWGDLGGDKRSKLKIESVKYYKLKKVQKSERNRLSRDKIETLLYSGKVN